MDMKRRPSTADPEVIEVTVRQFCKFVFGTRADFHAGIGPHDPLPLIETEARRVSAIITPTISKRSWYGLWHVLKELTAECNGDPVMAALLYLAIQCTTAGDALNRGEDETDVKRRIDDCVRDMATRMA
ncbi:hypothetical protein [Paraburkholderia sediminicola]|uniref:hypothetical protein n=1 Tax=Paraburkholderia sediminicola TaxID=458836 RepID=UPI0038BD8056